VDKKITLIRDLPSASLRGAKTPSVFGTAIALFL